MASDLLVKLVPHHPPLLVMFEKKMLHDHVVAPTAVAYTFQKADHRSIEEVPSQLNWEHILDTEDVNFAPHAYAIVRHVPKKMIQEMSCVPWMLRELRSWKTDTKSLSRNLQIYARFL